MTAIDKNSDEYKAILKYTNVILTNANKENIDDLLQFQLFPRIELLKQHNRDALLNGLAAEIFASGKFDKYKCSYYKKHVKNWHFCVFKSVIKQLGLKLKSTQVNTAIKLETGQIATVTNILYSIVSV